jgi:hypothetical protein
VKSEIWIGVAEVVALPGCKRLGTGKGAFVNVALWADSDSDFYSRASRAISALDLEMLELEDREPMAKRLSRKGASEETLQIAETAGKHPEQIVFGTFHVWEKTDA